MSDFIALPQGAYRLENLTVPAALIGQDGDLVPFSLSVEGARFGTADLPAIDMKGAMILPAFTDMHTHLDKGHIWGRAPNPDGTFMGALNTVAEDRGTRWKADDVRARMTFSLKCAYAHGTRAIRTHLDSIPPQDDISWPVFDEVRAEWADRIALQGACLVAIDHVNDGTYAHTADLVKRYGGILGAVTYPVPDLDARLDIVFRLAAERGLPVDFHTDETTDPTSATLRAIAEAKLRAGLDGPVVVGHCCSLAYQDAAEVDRTLDLVAQADLQVVSLPMCNMYLQDRGSARTPRLRGVTLVHEMAARGINVSFASDNTRDPFYAYGDMDMVEVMREATRIAHLDHVAEPWVRAFNLNPSTATGFDTPGLAPGAPADFCLFNARSWTEFFARPQSDRVVVRGSGFGDDVVVRFGETVAEDVVLRDAGGAQELDVLVPAGDGETTVLVLNRVAGGDVPAARRMHANHSGIPASGRRMGASGGYVRR